FPQGSLPAFPRSLPFWHSFLSFEDSPLDLSPRASLCQPLFGRSPSHLPLETTRNLYRRETVKQRQRIADDQKPLGNRIREQASSWPIPVKVCSLKVMLKWARDIYTSRT